MNETPATLALKRVANWAPGRMGPERCAAARLVSEEMQDDFSAVRRTPVFKKINPLPGPEHHTPGDNWNGKLRLR
jgi:hypothetical protein